MTVAELWEKVQRMILEESPDAQVLVEVRDRIQDFETLWVAVSNHK